VTPGVGSGVSLLHKRRVPIVLEDVNSALGAARSRSTHCCQSASSINGDCCAEEVAGGERRGWCEQLRGIEELQSDTNAGVKLNVKGD
jgi:hypothetical protein